MLVLNSIIPVLWSLVSGSVQCICRLVLESPNSGLIDNHRISGSLPSIMIVSDWILRSLPSIVIVNDRIFCSLPSIVIVNDRIFRSLPSIVMVNDRIFRSLPSIMMVNDWIFRSPPSITTGYGYISIWQLSQVCNTVLLNNW